jgi:hypothetical protein
MGFAELNMLAFLAGLPVALGFAGAAHHWESALRGAAR